MTSYRENRFEKRRGYEMTEPLQNFESMNLPEAFMKMQFTVISRHYF
jgi:hypothetical protein